MPLFNTTLPLSLKIYRCLLYKLSTAIWRKEQKVWQSQKIIKIESINARVLCLGGREFTSQRPARSYAALQTVRHRFNIYAGTSVALALCRCLMGIANLSAIRRE